MTPTGELRQWRVLRLGQAGLGREEQVPEPERLGFRLEFFDDRWDDVTVGPGLAPEFLVRGFAGQHAITHERDQLLLEWRGQRETWFDNSDSADE